MPTKRPTASVGSRRRENEPHLARARTRDSDHADGLLFIGPGLRKLHWLIVQYGRPRGALAIEGRSWTEIYSTVVASTSAWWWVRHFDLGARSSMTSKVPTSANSLVNWSVTSLQMPAVPKDVWTNRLTSFFVKNPHPLLGRFRTSKGCANVRSCPPKCHGRAVSNATAQGRIGCSSFKKASHIEI